MKSKFEQQLRDDLLSLESDIDLDIKQELNATRKRAVDSYRRPWIRRLQQTLWPAAGMTLASLLVFMVVLSPISPLPSHDKVVVEGQSLENMDLLEDLDFYYWLSENEAMLRG